MSDAKKTLRLTQVKSSIGYKKDQAATLKALGLGKIGRSIDQVDNANIRGMIFKVKHLIKVESSQSPPWHTYPSRVEFSIGVSASGAPIGCIGSLLAASCQHRAGAR